jgi:hypothetical protein
MQGVDAEVTFEAPDETTLDSVDLGFVTTNDGTFDMSGSQTLSTTENEPASCDLAISDLCNDITAENRDDPLVNDECYNCGKDAHGDDLTFCCKCATDELLTAGICPKKYFVGDGNAGFAKPVAGKMEELDLSNWQRKNLAGGVDGDPHFQGFDGSKFDFHGEAGTVFNLISDIHLQMNALFIATGWNHKTFMGAIGLKLTNNTIIVNFDNVTINGVMYKRSSEVVSLHGVGLVLIGPDFVSVHGLGFIFEIHTRIHKEQHGTRRCRFFNVNTSGNHFVNPHGILGQTARFEVNHTTPHPVTVPRWARNAKGLIEGGWRDYIVQDGIAGVKFKYNHFTLVDQRAHEKVKEHKAMHSRVHVEEDAHVAKKKKLDPKSVAEALWKELADL